MQPADLKTLLWRLDISAAEFARRWELNQKTVSRLLAGTRRITPRSRNEICETAVEILIGRRLSPVLPRGTCTDSTPDDVAVARDPAREKSERARQRKRAVAKAAATPRLSAASTPRPAPASRGCQFRELGPARFVAIGRPTARSIAHGTRSGPRRKPRQGLYDEKAYGACTEIVSVIPLRQRSPVLR
jgi:hypothetical protein